MAKSEKTPKQGASKQADKISAKKIGVNMIATIDGKKYSAKLSAENVEAVKKRIELYNKRPSETGKKAIIKLLTPETVKKEATKEKLKTKEKGYKKLVKRSIKQIKAKSADKETRILIRDVEEALVAEDISVAELEELLRRAKGIEEKAPREQYTKDPRRGEVYRNGRLVDAWLAEDGTEVDRNGYRVTDPVNN